MPFVYKFDGYIIASFYIIQLPAYVYHNDLFTSVKTKPIKVFSVALDDNGSIKKKTMTSYTVKRMWYIYLIELHRSIRNKCVLKTFLYFYLFF